VVQDHEFVSAPSRDDITRANDGAQPARDFSQELVARAMAEAVVDLFEVVEIEEHHGHAVEEMTIRTQGPCELVLEAAAIGQVGHGVETRHSINLELRVAPLGDVLNDHDGPLAFHPMDGEFERAAVSSFKRRHDVRPAIVVEQSMREMSVL
jgi:hypothetical protein